MYTLLFGSGMAAISCLLSVCNPGDRVVVAGDLNVGVDGALERVFRRFFVSDRRVDPSDTKALQEAVRASRLLLLESPADPVVQVADMRAVISAAHAAGCLVAFDNSRMTPYVQRPLALGADIAVYTTSAQLCGRRGIFAGALVIRDRGLAKELQMIAAATGSSIDPWSAWSLLAGLRTLGVRMTRQQESAEEIARKMSTRDWVRRVHYPGLATDPGHKLQLRQAEGFGAVLALDAGDWTFIERLASNLRIFTGADDCGAADSAFFVPAHAKEGAGRSADGRAMDGFIRLSIGLEHPNDLIEDLDRAAAAAGAGGGE